MTLRADSKKRVVLPGAAPGDVFTFEENGAELTKASAPRGTAEKANKSEGSESDTRLEERAEDSLGRASSHDSRTLILCRAHESRETTRMF